MKQLLLLLTTVFALWAEPSYMYYEKLLTKGVCAEGVNYELLRGDALVPKTAEEFEKIREEELKSWSEASQIAWYSNLYNFYTIKLILDKSPKKSIQDIPSAWDVKFVPLFGKKVSLNYIEHTILRKNFDEPRIHFALNCASIGCPALRVSPFRAATLSKALDEQALLFLKDEEKNRVDGKKLLVSQIFQWYGDDFKKQYGSYKQYVKQVLGLSGTYRIGFTNYDWNLNRSTCN